MRWLTVVAISLLLAVSLFSCTQPAPKEIQPLTPQQNVPNPHATQQPVNPEDVGTPTVIPADTDLKEYIKEYYEAYMKGEFEKAYTHLPAVNKARESTEAFAQSRAQMPITSYEIGEPIESQEGTRTVIQIPVSIDSSGMKFETVWIFEKQEDGSYIVKATQTAITQ